MVVLLGGSPISRGTLELCPSDHQVIGHIPDKGPSPPMAQFGRAASSRKSLGGSKLPPFKTDGGTCVLEDIQDIFWCPSSDLCLDKILSQSSTDNSINLIHS